MVVPKTLEEAALAVDEMLNLAFQNSGGNRDTLFFHNVVLRNYFQLLPVKTVGMTVGTKESDPRKMKTATKTMVLLNHP